MTDTDRAYMANTDRDFAGLKHLNKYEQEPTRADAHSLVALARLRPESLEVEISAQLPSKTLQAQKKQRMKKSEFGFKQEARLRSGLGRGIGAL